MVNFPELISIVKKEDNKIEMNNSYIEKLKKVEEVNTKSNIDDDLVNIKPGWVLIKRDASTGKIIFKEKKYFFFISQSYD